MEQSGLIVLGAALGYYAYLRLAPQPVPEPRSGASSSKALPVHDKRWSALRFYNPIGLNPLSWPRIKDPSAAVKYTRDKWKREDGVYGVNEALYMNPQRAGLRRMITGGAQPRRNPKAPAL